MREFVLIAQDAPAGAGKDGGPGGFGGISPLFLMIAMFGMFYLLVIRPANRRQKQEQAQMLASIKPGAKIVLNSGIVGRVARAKEGEDEIVIQSEDAKLRVLRTAVMKVLGEETTATPEVKS